jgi:hypothetical protein
MSWAARSAVLGRAASRREGVAIAAIAGVAAVTLLALRRSA